MSTPARTTSRHRRRLDDYAAAVVRRTAAANVAPQELSEVRLQWYRIVDQADADPVVYIYDEIGGSFGVDAETFAKDLNEITAEQITLRINSPGGSVFDGIAIYNTLIAHPARIVAYVDSLAASIASVIAMAADELVMMPGSQLMIHDALGIEMGNAADMRAMSVFLDRQSDNIASIYQMKAGGEAPEWRERMLAETWMFAGEAVAMGLADRVESPPRRGQEEPAEDAGPDLDVELEDLMARTFNVAGRYKYAGRDQAPDPAAPSPAARGDGPPRGRPLSVQLDVAALRQALKGALR